MSLNPGCHGWGDYALVPVKTEVSVCENKWSASDCTLSVNGSRLSVNGSRLSVSDSRLSVNGSRLPVNDSRLSVNDSRLSVNDSRFSVSDIRLSVSESVWQQKFGGFEGLHKFGGGLEICQDQLGINRPKLKGHFRGGKEISQKQFGDGQPIGQEQNVDLDIGGTYGTDQNNFQVICHRKRKAENSFCLF